MCAGNLNSDPNACRAMFSAPKITFNKLETKYYITREHCGLVFILSAIQSPVCLTVLCAEQSQQTFHVVKKQVFQGSQLPSVCCSHLVLLRTSKSHWQCLKESGCIPIKFYLRNIHFIIFMCHEIFFFFVFFDSLEMWKNILSL